MAELIANQFNGLDMQNLIAGPLIAASKAQSIQKGKSSVQKPRSFQTIQVARQFTWRHGQSNTNHGGIL
jgi:hypothetical protein